MELFLYLQVKAPEAIRYGDPFPAWVKEKYPEGVIFDADNHSEPLLIDQGLALLAQARCVALIIEADGDHVPGALTRLIERALRVKHKEKVVFFNGENRQILHMLRLTRTPFLHNEGPEKVRSVLRGFPGLKD